MEESTMSDHFEFNPKTERRVSYWEEKRIYYNLNGKKIAVTIRAGSREDMEHAFHRFETGMQVINK